MSPRVFHAAGGWSVGARLRLDPEESRYLLRVRRIRVGEGVEVLDGHSAAWRARLVEAEGKAAVVELDEPVPEVDAMPLELLLLVPEPRATLEALTLASELGATAIHLVRGEHSPTGLPSPERITKTLRASQRQCGRPRPPAVHRPASLEAALRDTEARPGFVASVALRHRATPVAVDPAVGARLLVGPEGWLMAEEAERAEQAGLRPLALGPWVLRTPTAVAAGLARLRGACEGPARALDGGPG